MGCSSCGKRSSAKAGTGVFNAITVGSSTASGDVFRVMLLADGVVGSYEKGQIVYVTGSGVDALVDDGSVEVREVLYGAALSRGRLYCVIEGDIEHGCWANLTLARDKAVQTGGTISVRMS